MAETAVPDERVSSADRRVGRQRATPSLEVRVAVHATDTLQARFTQTSYPAGFLATAESPTRALFRLLEIIEMRQHPKPSAGILGIVLTLIVALVAVAPAVGEEGGPKATVADLAWMTGSWSGALGPNTLEEQWSKPKAGSIAALVRMSSATATSMIELIVVEQEGESLVLRVQQWNPGFKPRSEGPQTMRLVELGERTVTFQAVEEGGLQGLTYARPKDDEFTISLLNAEGGAFKIELRSAQ